MSLNVWGFDGERKGFVTGGGLGYAPLIKTSWPNRAEDEYAGVGANFFIGYAWDDQNMLVYEGNIGGYEAEFNNLAITQGFNGAIWYHYFGEVGKSGFTTFGLGLYHYQIEHSDAADMHGAWMFGGGYEFARHWQIGVYISLGKTSYYDYNLDHANINVLVSTVAF